MTSGKFFSSGRNMTISFIRIIADVLTWVSRLHNSESPHMTSPLETVFEQARLGPDWE